MPSLRLALTIAGYVALVAAGLGWIGWARREAARIVAAAELRAARILAAAVMQSVRMTYPVSLRARIAGALEAASRGGSL